MNEFEKITLGMAGSVNETGTTAKTGLFFAITCLTDTVFALLTDQMADGDTLVGVTLPAGTTLYGRFTAFTLTSGAVRAYKPLRA